MAQTQYIISGKVTDAVSNEALPGVSVKLSGNATGAVTDVDGNYRLSVSVNPGSYTLQASYIGYKTTSRSVTLGSANEVTANFSLALDVTGLDEVVVTGTSAGTTRRQLGNYVSTVKGEDLTKGATGNVLGALQGKTLGAQITQNSGDPAGGMSVRLRGVSSIGSSSEPLYIIDGVIISNSTNRVTNTSSNYDGGNFVGSIGQNRMVDINPADIERIEVLNGAAAAAIYGSRANAGVVQIFTKRGVAGTPQLSFSTNVTNFELRKKLDVNQAPIKFGGSPNVFTQDIITAVAVTPGTTPVLLTNTTPVTRYDYQDYIFDRATGTDNTLSLSGGKDDTKYYTSLSYLNNQGIIRNTNFKRFNFRTNLDQRINKWATLTAGVNYINSSANEKPEGNSFFSPTNSINIIGNFHDIFARDAVGNLVSLGERGRVNPVSIIEDFKQRQETNRFIGNATLKLFPIKDLQIDYTFGLDNVSQKGTTYIPPFAYNVSTAFFGGGPSLNAADNGYISTGENREFQINNELNVTYNWKISDNLASTSQLGYSYQNQRSTLTVAQGRGLTPFIETLNGANTLLPSSDVRPQFWIAGSYFQQNLKYKNNLFFTGAVRVDASSVFGKNNRTQVYLKGSGSYVLSSTDYWETLGVSDWWDVFKLRLAYGQSGNLTGIGAYQRFNTYGGNNFINESNLTSSTVLSNPDIAPERQGELEVGTDLSFLKNRLGLNVNWYSKKVKDLIFERTIASTTGYSAYLDNFGSLTNKGIEIMLSAVPVKGKDFTWNASVLFNRNRNKAIDQPLSLFNTNSGAPIAIVGGQPVGVFYGTFYSRNQDGSILKNSAGIPQMERGVQNGLNYTVQRDANGLPVGTSTTLRKIIGDPNPDFTATLINEFSYRNINLRVQLDQFSGGDIFNADYRTRQGVGSGKMAEQETLGQLPRGYISGVYPIEEFRIDNGSFVKLREIYLGYALGKVGAVKNLTLSLSGRNLISWDNYKGYDPEGNSAGQSTLLRGIDFGNVPIPRTFSLGLQASF
jgi:TonB-linked SusC/RagA family outer membrane protein